MSSSKKRPSLRTRLIAMAATATALGVGSLVLQRWIAQTRPAAMVLVTIWFLLVAAVVVAYSRRRPDIRGPMVATVLVIAVGTVAIGYWTGFRKTEVNEMILVAPERAEAAPDRSGRDSPGPATIATGSIEGRDGHTAAGQAALVEDGDGQRVLTLADFDSDPGPDVDVYLSTSEAGIDDAVRIADLKASGGNHQYEIPAGVDIGRYDAVVLWCIPFTTRIATADLR